jgi:Type II CAAX prenyl endopeptidase Rce1-like
MSSYARGATAATARGRLARTAHPPVAVGARPRVPPNRLPHPHGPQPGAVRRGPVPGSDAAVAPATGAAVFGLAQVYPPLVVFAFLVGLVRAHLRERSGSIWPAVVCHAVVNSASFVLVALVA